MRDVPGVDVAMKWKAAWRSALLERNLDRLRLEVRETRELYGLLRRAMRGPALSAEERQRMRGQLLDLAKVIPALLVFAAPGGLLLLVVLGKVLPFSLLPSAFQASPVPAASRPRDDAPPGREAR
jgi:hypothetical protein